MYKKLLIFICLISTPFCFTSEIEMLRRAESALLIGDKKLAKEEAKAAYELFPESPKAHTLYIKCLARLSRESEMMAVWEKFHAKFPEDAMKDSLLEEMCFGILQKGVASSQLPIKLIGLIGYALTQDVRAVSVLQETMHDTNASFRAIAVELAALYGDTTLKEEIQELFMKEKSWEVREAQLAAIAKLKLNSLRPYLVELLSKQSVSCEEKSAITATLAELHEKVEKSELEMLAKSNWASLRSLAAKLIANGVVREESALLESLLNDQNIAVKKAALTSWGILRLKTNEAIKNAAASKNPDLSILANWVILLEEPEVGKKGLQRWLEHDNESVRSICAGAIAKAGSYGVDLAYESLKTSRDPYVRANLALALLRERVHIKEASDELYKFLTEHSELLSWDEGFFKQLQKSTVKHDPLVAGYPESVNQAVRLEILNLLAIVEYPRAIDATKEFLKMHKWDIVGLAAENLLGSGDESALKLVEKLLHDSDEKISLNAAILLALWGGGEGEALQLLLENYPKQERKSKIKILEAISHLGERKTVPFLINQLKEPSQTLRIIAASVLIQTLHQ